MKTLTLNNLEYFLNFKITKNYEKILIKLLFLKTINFMLKKLIFLIFFLQKKKLFFYLITIMSKGIKKLNKESQKYKYNIFFSKLSYL
jgi:hypothetical protein